MQVCDGGRDCDNVTELMTDGVPVCADCRALDALDVEAADLARRGRRVG